MAETIIGTEKRTRLGDGWHICCYLLLTLERHSTYPDFLMVYYAI